MGGVDCSIGPEGLDDRKRWGGRPCPARAAGVAHIRSRGAGARRRLHRGGPGLESRYGRRWPRLQGGKHALRSGDAIDFDGEIVRSNGEKTHVASRELPVIADPGRAARRRAADDRPRPRQRPSCSRTRTCRGSTPRCVARRAAVRADGPRLHATAPGLTASRSSAPASPPGAEVGIGPVRAHLRRRACLRATSAARCTSTRRRCRRCGEGAHPRRRPRSRSSRASSSRSSARAAPARRTLIEGACRRDPRLRAGAS